MTVFLSHGWGNPWVRDALGYDQKEREMQIISSKESFDVLVPDGRELLTVKLDGQPAALFRTAKLPGWPYSILTFACDRQPKTVEIEFKE